MDIDSERKRISLSIKEAMDKSAEETAVEAEEKAGEPNKEEEAKEPEKVEIAAE